MLNKNRAEVIDVINRFLAADFNDMYYEDLIIHLKKLGFKGELFTEDYEKWANSEYLSCCKITKEEEILLKLYNEKNKTHYITHICRREHDELYVGSEFKDVYYFACIDNSHFNFIKKGEIYLIEDILKYCEVVK